MKVFDFFSGCGGTSLGFQHSGFNIIGGLDFDMDSANTYRNNFPNARFIHRDIRLVNPDEIQEIIGDRNTPLLFSGCAPCQPFSGQRKITQKNDPRREMLFEFQRFIQYFLPEYIFLENVPGIQNLNKSSGVFKQFTNSLSELGYIYDVEIVDATSFGVPQTRKRLVLVAGKAGFTIKPISNVLNDNTYDNISVSEAIHDLPAISAGETHHTIPNHTSAKLSDLNLCRIQNTPEGGDRRNWPENLKVGCHKNYRGHTDVYGRMSWGKPASTLTTRCISYSNGRFGHPEQDRAISVREAARIQTFPDSFIFSGAMNSTAKQVGNAVPPRMAQALTECFG